MAAASRLWQSLLMQTLHALLAIVPSVIFGVGTIITIVALRRAPEGLEDAEGFHYRHPFAMPRANEDRPAAPEPVTGGTRFA